MDAFRQWLTTNGYYNELNFFNQLSQPSVPMLELQPNGTYIQTQPRTPTYNDIRQHVMSTYNSLLYRVNNPRGNANQSQRDYTEFQYYDSLWRAMVLWEGNPSNMSQQISGWSGNPFRFGSTKSLNADIVYLKNL